MLDCQSYMMLYVCLLQIVSIDGCYLSTYLQSPSFFDHVFSHTFLELPHHKNKKNGATQLLEAKLLGRHTAPRPYCFLKSKSANSSSRGWTGIGKCFFLMTTWGDETSHCLLPSFELSRSSLYIRSQWETTTTSSVHGTHPPQLCWMVANSFNGSWKSWVTCPTCRGNLKFISTSSDQFKAAGNSPTVVHHLIPSWFGDTAT